MTEAEMDAIVAGLTTKSDKVRALFAAGVPKADLSRFLGIRYQHTYNILKRELKGGSSVSADIIPSEVPATIVKVVVGKRGELVLPPAVLEQLGVEAGDAVFISAGSDGVRLITRETAIAQVREAARLRMPDEAAIIDALLDE